jgi:hypothetical protein
MSRSNSTVGLAIRAAISGVLLYFMTDGIMWLASEWFIKETDDAIVFGLFIGNALQKITAAIFSICILLAVLPVPAAYLGIGALKVLEFIFRKCIESNKGGFIALCAFIGSLATVYKLFA